MSNHAPFFRHLKAWTPYVLLIAAPSFGAAYLVEFNRPQSIVGMVGGIAVFLVLFAAVWSSAWFRRRVPEGCPWDRALTYGARARAGLSVLGLFGVLLSTIHGTHSQPPPYVIPFLMILMPDLLSGFLSGLFINWAVQSPFVRTVRVMVAGPDAHERSQSLVVGDVNSLVPTFVTTLAQGVLLTLMLLLLALVCRGCMSLHAGWKSGRASMGNPTAALT